MEENSLESTQKKIALPRNSDLGVGVTRIKREPKIEIGDDSPWVSDELNAED